MIDREFKGYPFSVWVELFRECYQWVYDGGRASHKGFKNKEVRTGQWLRTSYLFDGLALDQPNYVTEIFKVILSEEERIFNNKLG